MDDCNQVICVDEWAIDEVYDGVYPKGAREKDVYFSPQAPLEPWIKAAHRYLLKKSFARYPWQFWMEIIAYRVGQLVGVDVPPAFVGMRHEEGDGTPNYGALIEWFYSPSTDHYVDGGHFMTEAIPDYDVKKGSQHNLRTIIGLPIIFEGHREEWINYWSTVLAFDTIIGNTDRHQDNWGLVFIVGTEVPGMANVKYIEHERSSPAFDNGTALGHEILEKNFSKFNDEAYLQRYFTNPAKARHHMKWSLDEKEPMNFFQFMKRFVTEYPQVRERVQNITNFSQSELENRLYPLASLIDYPEYRLTEARLAFTIRLMMKRRELLQRALSE